MPAKKAPVKAPKNPPAKKPSTKTVNTEHQNLLNKVEEMIDGKMEQVLDKATAQQAEHVLHDFLGAFRGAELQDYVMFILGVVFLIRSLIELWTVVRGVILLLLALLLLNMFFGRK